MAQHFPLEQKTRDVRGLWSNSDGGWGGCCHCLVSSRPAVSVSLLPVSDSSGVCIGQFWHFTASSCHPRGPFHMSWALPRLGWTQLVSTLLVLVSSVLGEGRNTQWGKPGTENCAPGLTGRSFWPCSSCLGAILGHNEFWRWNQNFSGGFLAENESGFCLGAIRGCSECWRWNPISAMGS